MDWTTLQQQAEALHMQLSQYEKWMKQKEALEKQLRQAEENVWHYTNLLEESARKIEKLEEETFLNKVKKLFQNSEEQISNLLEASAERELKLTEAQLIKEDLQDELVDIVYKINAVNEKEIRRNIEQTKIQMDRWLKEHAPTAATKLAELKQQQHYAQQLLKEINEAIDAGKKAKSALVDAANELNKAKDYSTWDTFLGGGVFVTHLKHEKLRVSNTYLHKAQWELQKFQNELLDLQAGEYRSLQVNVDGFVTFADYFFDDIFSAWSVHSKLNNSRQQVSLVLDDVSNALLKLQKQKAATQEKYKSLSDEIQNIFNSHVDTLKL